MENENGTVRSLRLFIVLISCAVCGFASDPPLPQPVATLALSEMHSSAVGLGSGCIFVGDFYRGGLLSPGYWQGVFPGSCPVGG
jgi:hypothetical protein